MPYSLRKIRGKNIYKVYNNISGKIHSKGTTQDKAKAQIRLLNSLEGEGQNQGRIIPAETLQSISPAPERPHNIPYLYGDLQYFFSKAGINRRREYNTKYGRARGIAVKMMNILRNGQRGYPLITDEELRYFDDMYGEFLEDEDSIEGDGSGFYFKFK